MRKTVGILIALAIAVAGCTTMAPTPVPSTPPPTAVLSPTLVGTPGFAPSSAAPAGVAVEGLLACAPAYGVSYNYGVKVILLEAVRGENAWELVKAANESNKPPSEGFEYVLARMRFEYYAKAKVPPGICCYELRRDQFVAYSPDGKAYESPAVVPPEPELTGKVCSGDFLEGWVAFQVPQSESKPLMAFTGQLGGARVGSAGLWFRLY